MRSSRRSFGHLGFIILVIALVVSLPFLHKRYARASTPTGLLAAKAVASPAVTSDNQAFPAEDQRFISTIYAAIKVANANIRANRARIKQLYGQWQTGKKLSSADQQWLLSIAEHYQLIQINFNRQRSWSALLDRVATVPASLALAQAIEESEWGRSRFAREGNNLYGVWCYTPGCGIVPEDRPKGAIYEVGRYPSIQASVDDYMHILNTMPFYAHLRALRTSMQRQDKNVSGYQLAMGLNDYSTERYVYVLHLQDLIRQYKLVRFDFETQP